MAQARTGLLVICLAGCSAATARAQQQQAQAPTPVRGWREATWGMTPDQVLAAFGGEVARLPKAEDFGGGSVAPIGIDGFDLAGTRVTVRFIFAPDSMRLVEVRLQRFEIKPSHCSFAEVPTGDCLIVRSRSAYDRMLLGLTEKYGAPTITQPDDRNSRTETVRSAWTFPETVIRLTYDYMPGIAQSTTLMYTAADRKARSVY